MAHWSKHDRKDCIAIDRVMVAVIMSYCPPNRPAINMSSRVKVDISVLAGEERVAGQAPDVEICCRLSRLEMYWADDDCKYL